LFGVNTSSFGLFSGFSLFLLSFYKDLLKTITIKTANGSPNITNNKINHLIKGASVVFFLCKGKNTCPVSLDSRGW
jgi:hypothetical protein